MTIEAAQRENRVKYAAGFYGQMVSGMLWLISASLATWASQSTAIVFLVFGGFLIFPITELIATQIAKNPPLSAENSIKWLGMQAAFVMPFSMPLLVPVVKYNPQLFYPATTILLGAHYCPFVFLYGMREFAALAGVLVTGGMAFGMKMPNWGTPAGFFTGTVLILFALVVKFTKQASD